MELSHTLEVRPNLYIRAFIKFYQLDAPYNLNTCKLFWGSIGLLVIPIFLLAFSPLIGAAFALTWIGNKIKAADREKRLAYASLSSEERKALRGAKAKPSRRSVWLEKLSANASMIWYKVQTPVTWFFRVFFGLAVLIGLTVLIIWAVGVIPGLPWGDILNFGWRFVLVAGIVVVVAIAIVYGAVKIQDWRESKPIKPKKQSVIKAMFHSFHDHTCANIKVAEKE